MEKFMDMMKRSEDLTSTMIEGLDHIQVLLGEGKFEQTIFLFEDILVAFSSMEHSIQSMTIELDCEKIGVQVASIKKILELVVSAYEEKAYGQIQEIIQFSLRPQFKKLLSEQEVVFGPYLLS